MKCVVCDEDEMELIPELSINGEVEVWVCANPNCRETEYR